MTDAQLIAALSYYARLALIAALQEETEIDFFDAQAQIEEATRGETLAQLWARLQALN